jgi:predicted PurR-regulated permease PerM
MAPSERMLSERFSERSLGERPDLTVSLAPPKRSWRRPIFLVVWGLIVIGVIVAAREVMLPFVLALVIAYVLTPLVAWVERKRVPRGASIILVYVVVLGTLGMFIRLTAPRVGQELAGLRRELPAMVTRAKDEWLPKLQDKLREVGLTPPPAPPPENVDDAPSIVARPLPDGSYGIDVGSGIAVVPRRNGYVIQPVHEVKEDPFDLNRVVSEAVGRSFTYAQHNALELARIGRDIVAGISRVIFVFGITLMLAAYIMLTRERIITFFSLNVRPSSRVDLHHLLARIDKGLSGVVRGQLIICLVNGVLSAIGFAIVGLKYWPVLALIATVLSLIPIFGSIVSAVPAVALGLTQSLGTAVFVLIWIVGIHQLEANFLNPKIMGDAAKIHPVLVIFSLLLGEHFFHTVGALLAVPCMSIAQSLFLHFKEIVQRDDPEFAADPPMTSFPPPPPR